MHGAIGPAFGQVSLFCVMRCKRRKRRVRECVRASAGDVPKKIVYYCSGAAREPRDPQLDARALFTYARRKIK